ncbi:MAG: SulP family inorganic anion transporter [Crocinitomicaceae bacterium]|nr:SulP family inorganic anion transporter [Crocinitomicaceae bacterium]
MKKTFLGDLIAGISVSFAALALGAAFGVMSGRGAFAGMIAAGIIPIITGIFGGTRLSVSGPTGPMTAVSAVVVAFAYDNFTGDKILAEQFITLVFLMTAIGLLIAGIVRLGKLIEFVPKSVILGFMSGIAMVIWVDQFNILFGLNGKKQPSGDFSTNIILAFSTFVLILLLPKILKLIRIPTSVSRFIPATLTAIIIMTIVTVSMNFGVETISLGASVGSFSEFTSLLSSYFPGSGIFTQEYILMALPYALQMVMLCYLDSLLTALIVDHLTKEKSNLNRELIGQGLSNGMSAIFMGIPGAQATIRSVLLYKEGGRTRVAAVIAGVFTLLGFLVFKDMLILVASSVFIGVLIKAALDVFERDFLVEYWKQKWYKNKTRNVQLFFILYTMLLTAFYDLNIAVFSATVLFYISKKFFKATDIEDNFADGQSNDVLEVNN